MQKQLAQNYIDDVSGTNGKWLTFEIVDTEIHANIDENTEMGNHAIDVIRQAKESGDYSDWQKLVHEQLDETVKIFLGKLVLRLL